MSIAKLSLQHFRNLQMLELTPSPSVNIIFGENGAGKTSLLEAIYYLGMGRSFRTRKSNNIVQKGKKEFILFAKTASNQIGMERQASGLLRFKVDDEDIHSVSQLAKHLPLQLINPDVYQLLNEGPKFRREFIDWGVFHVEHQFFLAWKEYHRIVKHRNLAIKLKAPKEEVQSWDPGLVKAGLALTKHREDYVKQWLPCFLDILAKILDTKGLSIEYYPGWAAGKDFLTQISEAYPEDRRYGFTSFGPHRADLLITIENGLAKDILSRGQQKLFAYAMRLAQGILLKEQSSLKCIYLIDDLPAELDENKREALFKVLLDLNAQIFVSTIDVDSVNMLQQQAESKVFHVEHGGIKAF